MNATAAALHLNWLVESRNAIQSLMLRVLTLLEKREAELNDSVSMLAMSHLMVAATYSLWRAVFLGNVSLTEERIAADAKQFLLILIRDNAIGYAQERDMREWTFGYYTNNARFRIGEIARKRPGFRKLLQENSCLAVDFVIAVGEKPEQLWNDACVGLQLAVQNPHTIFTELK